MRTNIVLCKISFALLIMTAGIVPATGQLALNPQIGINFTNLTVEPRSSGFTVDVEGKSGWLLGADMRVGGAFYLQPGAFITFRKSTFSGPVGDPADVKRYGGKLKGLLGYKILNGDAFKLRIAGGPTYDFQLGIDVDDNPYFNKDQFKSGIFGLDAGVGIDLAIFTAEFGYSWAFTEAFDHPILDNKPKFQTLYFTVGLVFGN